MRCLGAFGFAFAAHALLFFSALVFAAGGGFQVGDGGGEQGRVLRIAGLLSLAQNPGGGFSSPAAQAEAVSESDSLPVPQAIAAQAPDGEEEENAAAAPAEEIQAEPILSKESKQPANKSARAEAKTEKRRKGASPPARPKNTRSALAGKSLGAPTSEDADAVHANAGTFAGNANGGGQGAGRLGSSAPGPGLSARVDSKPKVLRRVRVTYPEQARKRKINGQVLLRFLLDEKGAMSQLQVLRSEPSGIFDSAALTAVRKWKFAPAVRDGKPVPYWVELPLSFFLEQHSGR